MKTNDNVRSDTNDNDNVIIATADEDTLSSNDVETGAAIYATKTKLESNVCSLY